MNSINLQGVWKGYYQYSSKKIQKIHKYSKTGFTIEITHFDGVNFEGEVYDDLESGGTRGRGIIQGKYEKNKISFVKKMPISTVVYPDGTVVEEDKPHRNIYYEGIFENTAFIGTWRFKLGIEFRRGILIYPPSKGTWYMEKSNENTLFKLFKN